MVQAIRGMNDILPEAIGYWQFIEKTFSDLVTRYGYQEIRFPILEQTELFKRSIGEVTDIVEKEMYTFNDRNNDSLTLRPEGTAGCVRAGLEHGLFYNQVQRLWYFGPMFRHERPQRGRYRQFYQFGLEAFGLQGPDIDAEHILLTARFWQALGIQDKVELQLNSLGSLAARARYRETLVTYFREHYQILDADSQRRLESNPLRILDSKNPELAEVIKAAPSLTDYLDDESKRHFAALCLYLDRAGVSYTLNPRLVRGLDYYCGTVFEWITTELGAQGTVCAGGRYDGLIEMLGGKSTPAVGFAIGIERLVELVKDKIPQAEVVATPHAYLILQGEKAEQSGIILAERLRNLNTKLRIVTHCGGGGFKSQFKRADKSGALIALIIGDEEIEMGTIGVKNLREDVPQQNMTEEELTQLLARITTG